MRLSADIDQFCQRLGHHFNRPELLLRALTHASRASPGSPSNERLEFLGDRVLGLAMATALMQTDRTAAEGQLAPRFNALVRQETCAEIARDLGLGDVLRLGRSEMLSGGRRKEALLADAMEAVLAAVYLDAGFDAARDLILRLWGERILTAEDRIANPKSTLQEWLQGRGDPPPDYLELTREGPPHAPLFTVEARLQDGTAARGQGASKRAAEQAAAQALLARLTDNG